MPRKAIQQRKVENNENQQQTQPQQTQPQVPQFDMSALFASAQNIMKNTTSDPNGRLDIGQMVNQVTDLVSNTLEQGGTVIDPASKQQMKLMTKMMAGQLMETMGPEMNVSSQRESKIDLGSETKSESDYEDDKIPTKEELFEEIDSDTEVDELRPIADDLYYKLQVTLEELYTGKVKKLAVSRSRLDKAGKNVVSEKRKIEVPILPGMKNGQEIRFNKEGNEKVGYRAGDIIIELAANTHTSFERVGDALCYVKNISLYESYAAAKGLINIVIQHLDGSYMVLKVADGQPLHTKDGARKVRFGGMPSLNRKAPKKLEYGDLYIRFNVILPTSFEGGDDLEIIRKLFPVLPTNKDSIIGEKYNDFEPGTAKVREVLIEEVTPEDMDQLDYSEEQEQESYESDEGSE